MFTFSDVVYESSALDGVLDEEYDGAYGMMVSKQWSLRTQHDKSSKQTRALNRAKEAWPDADRQDGISTVVDCLMSECNAPAPHLCLDGYLCPILLARVASAGSAEQ